MADQDKSKQTPGIFVKPKYECHKVVEALQVLEVTKAGDVVNISFAEPGAEPVQFHHNDAIFARYFPVIGDYLVFYSPDYQSFSPEAVFDSGYHKLEETGEAKEGGGGAAGPNSGEGHQGTSNAGAGGSSSSNVAGTGGSGGRGDDGQEPDPSGKAAEKKPKK